MKDHGGPRAPDYLSEALHKYPNAHFDLRRRRTEEMATLGGIRDVRGAENSQEVDSLARFAVDEHNTKENALLEFVKVVDTKEQVVAGTVYYITLEAKEGGKKKIYEAKIWVKQWMNFKELQAFKSLGDSPSEPSS
ncbi:cysteine proteinase inhibitor-like [Malania oleifera]|uniref:cysteine proteinase inhibitor-like n=1 Tax=Malania oleifera TaxID=397392 RepID=UPI0025ADCC83|nr:cysteine proteinase inhibitor-like [Malania oleifera]XP_057954617.1 cysteine proteinase inhibitor-like [Malania oleifera]